MKPRYKDRIPLVGHAVFSNGSQTGEGRVVNVTSPGCLIESAGIAVSRGQSLQLTITFHGHNRPLMVTLGVVRWTKGVRFGVEFIKMDHANRLTLNRVLAQHLPDTAQVRMKSRSFSEPAGRNWHLETYTISKTR
jgi:PilZ domain